MDLPIIFQWRFNSLKKANSLGTNYKTLSIFSFNQAMKVVQSETDFSHGKIKKKEKIKTIFQSLAKTKKKPTRFLKSSQ